MTKEVSTNEILEAINEFASAVERRFDGVEQRLDGVEQRLDGVEQRLDGVEQNIKGLGKDVSSIRSQMLTKDYLDEKIADLRGDMVVLTRKEDTKMLKLVEILTRRKVISQKEAKEIRSMEPFSQLSL
jgi:archaellum component FlaC